MPRHRRVLDARADGAGAGRGAVSSCCHHGGPVRNPGRVAAVELPGSRSRGAVWAIYLRRSNAWRELAVCGGPKDEDCQLCLLLLSHFGRELSTRGRRRSSSMGTDEHRNKEPEAGACGVAEEGSSPDRRKQMPQSMLPRHLVPPGAAQEERAMTVQALVDPAAIVLFFPAADVCPY